MSSDSEHDQSPTARTRKRLIDLALQRVHQARTRCQGERLGYGEVDEALRADFQHAILDLYWALRPLRREDAIDEWWEEVELSDGWTERVTAVDGDLHGQGVDVGVEERPKQGLETLRYLDDMTHSQTREVETFRGKQAETVVTPTILPYEILKDIAGTLEDAAGKLGFNPAVEKHSPRTEIDDELMERVKQWQQNNL